MPIINILRDISVTTNINGPFLNSSLSVDLIDYISISTKSDAVEVHGYQGGSWALIGTVAISQILDVKSYSNIFLKSVTQHSVRVVPVKSKVKQDSIAQRLKFGKGLSELSTMSDKDVDGGTYLKSSGAEELLSGNINVNYSNTQLKPSVSQVTSEYLYNGMYVINIIGENLTKDTEVYLYENTVSDEDAQSLTVGYLNHLDSSIGKLKDLVDLGLYSSKMSSVDYVSASHIPDEGLVSTSPSQTFVDKNPVSFVSSQIMKLGVEAVVGDKTYSLLIKNSNGSYLFKNAINLVITGNEPVIEDPLLDDDGDGVPNYLDEFPKFYGDVPEDLELPEDAKGSLDLWFNISSLPTITLPLYYPYYKVNYDYPELKAYYMDDDNVVHDVTSLIQILNTRGVSTHAGATNLVEYFISNDRVPLGIRIMRSVVVDPNEEGIVTTPEFSMSLEFNITPLPEIIIDAGTDISGFDYNIEGLKALYMLGSSWITVSTEQNPINISIPAVNTTVGGRYEVVYSFDYESMHIEQRRFIVVNGDAEIKWEISGLEVGELGSINFSEPVDFGILDFSEPQLTATYIRTDANEVVVEQIDKTASITTDDSYIPQTGLIDFGNYNYIFNVEHGLSKSSINKGLKILDVNPEEVEGSIAWQNKPSHINLSVGDALPDLSFANLSVKYIDANGQEYPLTYIKDVPSIVTTSPAGFVISFTPVDDNNNIPFSEKKLLKPYTIVLAVSSAEIQTDPGEVNDNSYIEFEPSALPPVVTQDNINFDIATNFNNFDYPTLKAYHYDKDGVKTDITGSVDIIIPENIPGRNYMFPYSAAFDENGQIRNDYPIFHSILYSVSHGTQLKILKRTFEIEDTVAPTFNKEPSEFLEFGTRFQNWKQQFRILAFFGQNFPVAHQTYGIARTSAKWSINISSNQFDNLSIGNSFVFSAETEDLSGNKTIMQKTITCRDSVAPEISFSGLLSFEPGASPSEQDMRSGFSVSDLSAISSTSVVYSSVDFANEGVYQAEYYAEDVEGNNATRKRTIVVATPASQEENALCLPTKNILPVQITTKTDVLSMTEQDWITPLKAADGSTDVTLNISVDYSTVNSIPLDGQNRVIHTVNGEPAVGVLPYQVKYTIQDSDDPSFQVSTCRPIELVDVHAPYFTNSPNEINIDITTSQISDYDLMLYQISQQLTAEDAITDQVDLNYSAKEGLFSAEAFHGNSVQKTIIVKDAAENAVEYGPVTINFTVNQILKGFLEEDTEILPFDGITSALDYAAKYYGYGKFKSQNNDVALAVNKKQTFSIWYQKTSNQDASNKEALVVTQSGEFKIIEDAQDNKLKVYDINGDLVINTASDWSSGTLKHVAISYAPNGSFRAYSQGVKVSESYGLEMPETSKAIFAGGPENPTQTSYPAGAYGYVDSVDKTDSILSDLQVEELYYLGQDVRFSELSQKVFNESAAQSEINSEVGDSDFYLNGIFPDSPDGNFIEFADNLTLSNNVMNFTSGYGFATLFYPLDVSGNFTITCWYKGVRQNGILFLDSVTDLKIYSINGLSQVYSDGGASHNLPGLSNDGLYHFLTFVGNGSEMKTYINGGLVSTLPQISGWIDTIKGVCEILDEVRYWSKSLTDEEISVIYVNSEYY